MLPNLKAQIIAQLPMPGSRRPVSLSADILTTIAFHTQDFEIPCDAAKTLLHVRELQELGLISKAWRIATHDPRLWARFLNAALESDKFDAIVARSGSFPVQVYFKPQSVTGTWHCTSLAPTRLNTEKATRMIDLMKRITILDLDFRSERDYDKEALEVFLGAPAPKLHSLTIKVREGIASNVARAKDLTYIAEQLRELKLVNCTMSPGTTEFPQLEYLELGVVGPYLDPPYVDRWVRAIERGRLPQLQCFTVILVGPQNVF